jgi:type IV secretory pathway VirB10-like protein
MSDPSHPQKVEPESLSLRAPPRKVVRFKRNLLIGAAAVCCLGLIAATWISLGRGGTGKSAPGTELFSVSNKNRPDGLQSLPSNYDKVKLGPPLPGDLGKPVVEKEASLGLAAAPYRPNAEQDAIRAERMRVAQQAKQARESGVLVQSGPAGTVAGLAQKIAPSVEPAAPSGPTSSGLGLDLANDQNGQGEKANFLKQKADADIYNPHTLQKPVSPYEVLAGSIISASLLTGLNSDLPGMVVAQITEPIFDSVTGKILLIPQGSRIVGTYDSVIAFGQSRALLVWQRIIMPDGSSVQIDNLPATDAAGYSGLEDEVDYHTWKLLEGVALSTLLGVGGQVAFGNSQSNLVEAIRESTQESTNQAGQHIVDKDLNIQPTITVRPGWPLRVIVHKDLVLKPFHA